MARSTTADERSLGELVSEAAHELSTLVHQEIDLAKAEIKQDVAGIGKGIGAVGAAGFAGYLMLLFLSLAAMFGLEAAGLPWALAALLVALFYGAAAGVLVLLGRRSFGRVNGAPRTARTLKEDVEWLRHPTS